MALTDSATLIPPNEDMPHVWARFNWAFQVIYLFTILVAADVTWTHTTFTSAEKSLGVGAAAVLGVAHLIILWRYYDPRDLEKFAHLRLGYTIIVMAIWYWVLLQVHTFQFILFGFFAVYFALLPLLQGSLAILLACLLFAHAASVATGQSFWGGRTSLLMLLAAVVSISTAAFMNRLVMQSRQRFHLIRALKATRAELAAAERSAGIAEERQRLARDIHDTLAQGFVSIIFQLDAAEAQVGANAAETRTQIQMARQTARENLAQARHVVNDLRPISLQDASLSEAIERTSRSWQAKTGIQTHLIVTGEPVGLAPDVEVAVLRMVQEGLSNVHKHAHASMVTVTLTFLTDLLLVDVADNGVGFSEPATDDDISSGYGLTAMRERLAQLGGALEVESELLEGTTLVAKLPLVARIVKQS